MSTALERVASCTPQHFDDGENNASPPAPPPRRVLELVKEEVHRALQAFSTRPIKGFADPPLPSDLLRPFDVCNDARVTYPEFQAGLRGLGIGLTTRQTESLAREVDTDDTGLVDRKTFEKAAIDEWGRDPGVVAKFPSPPSRYQRGRSVKGQLVSKNGTPRNTGQRVERRSGHNVKQKDFHDTDRTVRWDKAGFPDRPRFVMSSSAAPPVVMEEHGSFICSNRNSHSRVVNDHGDGGGGIMFPGKGSLVEGSQVKREIHGKDAISTSKARRGTSRNTTMSFNQWQRGAVTDRTEASVTKDAYCRALRSPTANDTVKIANGNKRSFQEGLQSLSTLRSLLLRRCLGDETNDHPLRQKETDGCHDPGHHPLQPQCNQDYDERVTSRVADEIRKDRGRRHFRQHYVRSSSAPAHSGALQGRGRSDELSGRYSYNEDALKPDVARAEKTLRLRSRDDLVGLRRAFSRADPSRSGVISSLEMERSILRRFEAGLGSKEARALASKHHRKFGIRSMVNYDHLVNDLEAVGVSEEFIGRAATGRELPNRSKVKYSPEATMASHRTHERGRHRHVAHSDPPVEESQLVRRSRAKALALLNRHGTASINRVFGHLDPARTGSVDSKQLRDGFKILAGRDPLSENEYRMLFSEISSRKGRIDYRDLIQTLSTAKAREAWEGTQRKLAHQAGLPVSGRGSGIHLRHSSVLDHEIRGNMVSTSTGLSGGRRHGEWRRRALVLQRLKNSVRKVQDERGSAEPVYDMFRHGQDRIHRVDTAGKRQSAVRSSHSLSCSALRRGLNSLGVPLGNEDFVALMATMDPMRQGEVSYADFCKTMDLHQVRDDCFRAATPVRETFLRPSISGMPANQGVVNNSKSSTVDTGGRGRSVETEEGGSARRRAMIFAPPDVMNLDGGIFHRNPATDGCKVPTYTTTMMTNTSRGNTNNGPRSRQSLKAARSSPHIFASGDDLIKDDVADIINSRRSPPRWGDTAEAEESKFRRSLGRRTRSCSSVSNCAGAHEPRGGNWDVIIGVASSPYQASDAYNSDSITRGNRRGRAYVPKNNDLGFGSERMRSQTRRDPDCTRRLDSERRSNQSSLRLGTERPYGNSARPIQHLLRDDRRLDYDVRPDRATAPESSVGRYFHDCGDRKGYLDGYAAHLSSSQETRRV